MGQKYLIDTNVIVDSIANKLPGKGKNLLAGNKLIVSAVTKIETLGWKDAPEKDLGLLYDLLEIAMVLQIDNAVIDKAIFIRQRKKIKLGDCIIAATALVHDCALITRNISDFKGIDGLNLIDPYSL